jgi:hypothetical protein
VEVTYALNFKSRYFVAAAFDDVLHQLVKIAPIGRVRGSVAGKHYHACAPEYFEVRSFVTYDFASCNIPGLEKHATELCCRLFGQINIA